MNQDRVKDVMTTLVVMIHPNDSIQQVARRLVRNRISGAPVVQDGKVLGIISDVDIDRTQAGSLRPATDLMSTPVVTVGPDDSLFKAAQLLERHGIKRLPVVDSEGFLLGIISRGDLVRAMTRFSSQLAV